MASSKPVNILQLKVSLKHLKPPIWRRVLVPENYTFFKLHEVIQVVMPWDNCHLHTFSMVNPKNGKETQILTRGCINSYKSFMCDDELVCEKDVTLGEYFLSPGTKAKYDYDLGSTWHHIIVLEKILPTDSKTYPRCVGGRTLCPKEDSGGYFSDEGDYEDFLEKEREERRTIKFDPKSVDFSRLNTLDDFCD